MPFLCENKRYGAGLTGAGVASTAPSGSKVQIHPWHMVRLIWAGASAPEQEGCIKWSCYPEPLPLAGQGLARARRGWRMGPPSVCTHGLQPCCLLGGWAAAAAGAVLGSQLRLSPAHSPPAPAESPLSREPRPASSSGGGWYRVAWPACHAGWKAATTPSLPAPFLPFWSKPVLGCAWCLGSFAAPFSELLSPCWAGQAFTHWRWREGWFRVGQCLQNRRN